MRRSLAAAITCLALGASGCFGGDDEAADRGDSQGEDYALAVERITDDVYEDAQAALTVLNRFADGRLEPAPVARELDRAADRTDDAKAELAGLAAPETADTSAGDLESALGTLALHLRVGATDVRATDRGISNPRAVGRSQASLVLAYQSGISALGRAVGRLAIESTD